MSLLDDRARQLLSNYKLTPATLANRLDPTWIPSPWLMYVSLKVANAIRTGNGRLIISVPPRHGKSRLITTYTSIWIQEIFRTFNIILTSYGADLSKDFGREVRNIIQDNEELLDVRIAPDKAQAGGWKNQWGGGMNSVGLGGSITGRGAHVLLIDDYIKEIKDALSQTMRDYVYNWFATTAYTRLEPGGTCIIIATRWHYDDLIGRLLKDNDGTWEYIHIPAIALENDILGRAPGEALFPERYPIEVLEERRRTLGTFFFNALYQQIPENPDAKLTDRNWINTISLSSMPSIKKMRRARVWDLAATEDGGDWTVGTLCAWDYDTDAFYILDVKREQRGPGGVESLVRRTAEADGTDVEIFIEQEPGSSGKALCHHYNVNVLPEFKVVPVPANDGKVTRAQPLLAAAEAGEVFLIKAGWNEHWLSEFDDFPGGPHDDQVDTASIGYSQLSGKQFRNAIWGRSNQPARKHQPGLMRDPLLEEQIRLNHEMMKQSMNKNGRIESGRVTGAIWGRR